MVQTLTAAGLALCTALTGASSPSVDTCDLAFMNARPPCDAWLRCPGLTQSSPDDSFDPPAGYTCTPVATYDIFDGSKGTTRMCTRSATLIWLPDGRWAWEFN